MNVTEVGSEKSMSGGGNYLVLHAPHILQRHCIITNMDGRVSVTPSSGDAEVSVNGKRFYETTTLTHNDVIKIGRMHAFRFCDPDDITTHVIKEALVKYQMEKENPEDYCLVMVNIPPEGHNTSATLGKERVVHDEDCPLRIAVTWPPSRGTVVFHLRRRANLPQHRQERRRSKSPARKPVDRYLMSNILVTA